LAGSSTTIENDLFNQLVGIVNGSGYASSCDSCQAATQLMHVAAITQPVQTVVNLLIRA
jgi:sphingomyelin phosphodiesterase